LLAPLPSDELYEVAASINSSTDLSDSDSNSNSDMADINPSTFSGTASEDAENWLQHFCNFCDFKAHSPSKVLSLFKDLMAGSAAARLDSLSDDVRSDWGGGAAKLFSYTLYDGRVSELQKRTQIV